jgi:hypothetical protein
VGTAKGRSEVASSASSLNDGAIRILLGHHSESAFTTTLNGHSGCSLQQYLRQRQPKSEIWEQKLTPVIGLHQNQRLPTISRLQVIYSCSVEKIGCVPLTTNIGVLLSSLRWVSEWRDRTGFNVHPHLIPAVNLLMQ